MRLLRKSSITASSTWVHHKFISTRKAIRLLILSAAFIALLASLFIFAALKLSVPPLEFTAPTAEVVSSDITFGVEVIAADPLSRTITTDWYPSPGYSCFSDMNFAADIFFNPGYLDPSSPSFASPPQPVYHFNSSRGCNDTLDSLYPYFRVVSKLLAPQALSRSNFPQASVQSYPFDAYFARYVISAVDIETGELHSINVTSSFGIAVNFEITLEQDNAFGDVQPHLFISLHVKRSLAIRLFVVLISVTNWLIAAAFMVISVASVLYPSPEIFAEMFVVPVGALFAFTSVRANLPGAPAGFGAAIDFFSILPVLVVLAVSSAFLLLVILSRRIQAGGGCGSCAKKRAADESIIQI